MDDKLLTAGIAALVSIVVSLVSYVVSSRQIFAQREKLEREIAAKRTDLLYDLRLKLYPKFFELTVDLHRDNASFASFMETRKKIRDWRSGEPMLVLSKHSLQSLYDLERALSKKPNGINKVEYTDQQLQKLWRLRLRARGALRKDLGLLYDDPAEANFWRGKSVSNG